MVSCFLVDHQHVLSMSTTGVELEAVVLLYVSQHTINERTEKRNGSIDGDGFIIERTGRGDGCIIPFAPFISLLKELLCSSMDREEDLTRITRLDENRSFSSHTTTTTTRVKAQRKYGASSSRLKVLGMIINLLL